MQDDIISNLETLTIAEGFTKDVSVLDGYMVHYAKDLLERNDGIGFPCVAVQPQSDNVQPNQSQDKGKVTRIVKVIGAVDATDKSKVNADINQLVYDVRKVLSIDKYDNNSKAESITLGGVEYALPDKQEQYAYFEMSVNINYVEQWK